MDPIIIQARYNIGTIIIQARYNIDYYYTGMIYYRLLLLYIWLFNTYLTI